MKKILIVSFLSYFFFLSAFIQAQPIKNNSCQSTNWIVSKLINSENVSFLGDPQVINCPYGEAVRFDGISDGIFIDAMPLKRFSQFTVEAIFYPESKSNFEQRFLHFGEIADRRLLFEIRATENEWYFDAYINTGKDDLALIDENLLHKLDCWYHVAFTVDNGNLTTYVNGKKELEGEVEMAPINTGQTSVGVRQNKVSWFKGAIYKIRVTPNVLAPDNFMKF